MAAMAQRTGRVTLGTGVTCPTYRFRPAEVAHAFASLAADAIEAAQQTFETAASSEDEPGIDLSKLARPTSTWTYMVHDNPLADEAMSALSLPGVFR